MHCASILDAEQLADPSAPKPKLPEWGLALVKVRSSGLRCGVQGLGSKPFENCRKPWKVLCCFHVQGFFGDMIAQDSGQA